MTGLQHHTQPISSKASRRTRSRPASSRFRCPDTRAGASCTCSTIACSSPATRSPGAYASKTSSPFAMHLVFMERAHHISRETRGLSLRVVAARPRLAGAFRPRGDEFPAARARHSHARGFSALTGNVQSNPIAFRSAEESNRLIPVALHVRQHSGERPLSRSTIGRNRTLLGHTPDAADRPLRRVDSTGRCNTL